MDFDTELENVPATKGDIARLEVKVEAQTEAIKGFVEAFNKIGNDLTEVFNGGGMGGMVKALMGRD